MPFVSNRGLRWYEFDLFQGEKGLIHGVFTRQGGISPEPWDGLNMATSVGDSRERVIENRRRILDAMGLQDRGFFDVWQVHGRDVLLADRPRMDGEAHQKADGMVTQQDHLALLMLFADCVPVILFDPVRNAVGMAHAGWQGTVKKVPAAAVEQMNRRFGSRPQNLLAGIGPSICPGHYQVGSEVIEHVAQAFGDDTLLTNRQDGKGHLDLWEANRRTLLECGLTEDHIQVSGICTLENPADWYSHRGEGGKTGRFGAVAAIRQGL